jgi:hypothetical protein
MVKEDGTSVRVANTWKRYLRFFYGGRCATRPASVDTMTATAAIRKEVLTNSVSQLCVGALCCANHDRSHLVAD